MAVTRRLPANMHSTSRQHPGNIQASSDQQPFNILNVISTGGFTCRASRCCRFCLALVFAHACNVVCMGCRVRECALLVCVPVCVCVSKQQCGNHTANDLRINHGRKHSNTSTRVPVSAKKRWDKQNGSAGRPPDPLQSMLSMATCCTAMPYKIPLFHRSAGTLVCNTVLQH